MQIDLHRALRDTCRKAVARGRTSQEAFEAASELVSANTPYLAPRAARRLAAEMLYKAEEQQQHRQLCEHPGELAGNHCQLHQGNVAIPDVYDLVRKEPADFAGCHFGKKPLRQDDRGGFTRADRECRWKPCADV